MIVMIIGTEIINGVISSKSEIPMVDGF